MNNEFLAAVVLLLAQPVIASAANHDIQVGSGGLKFSPKNSPIIEGDTVTFKNTSRGFHNAVSDDGTTFSSGAASTDAWTLTVPFPTAGVFAYHCEIHGGVGGQGMAGTITVLSETVFKDEFELPAP